MLPSIRRGRSPFSLARSHNLREETVFPTPPVFDVTMIMGAVQDDIAYQTLVDCLYPPELVDEIRDASVHEIFGEGLRSDGYLSAVDPVDCPACIGDRHPVSREVREHDSLTAWTHRVPCQEVCLGCEILSCGHPPTLFGDLGSQHVEDASMSDYQTCHLFSKFL